MTERKECQDKMDRLMQSKTLLAEYQKQIFDAKVRQKSRPKLKSSKSQSVISSRPNTGHPTMAYVTNPPVRTQKQLFKERKAEFLADCRKCEAEMDYYKSAEQRLNNRETCNLRITHREPKPKVKKIDHFEPNVKYGIHEKPLPHYADNLREWWTVQNGYNSKPNEVSHLKLQHKIMLKNPSDAYLLAKIDNDVPPQDNFKRVHCITARNTKLPEKPNNIKKKVGGKNMKKKKGFMRWTDIENMYTRKKERIFAHIPESIAYKADIEPMYSSFNPKKIFRAPPSSKEALMRQTMNETKNTKQTLMGTKENPEIKIDDPAYEILDIGKVNFFRRVKTAYGKRSDSQGATNNAAIPATEATTNKSRMDNGLITFKSSSQVGFRTGAFNHK